jgi:hypothetical protein
MEASRVQEAGCPQPAVEATAVVGEAAERKAPAYASQRVDAQRRRAALARLLRMGVSDGARSPSGDAATTSDLEAELALLREENARLKVERHRPADAGHVIERMRSLRLEGAVAGQAEMSEPAGVIAECLAMREGLMDACQEVQQAMQGIRGRLGALAGDIHSRVEDEPKPARLIPSAETVAVEPLGIAGDSELAQSVA